jgi:hypothetical protein
MLPHITLLIISAEENDNFSVPGRNCNKNVAMEIRRSPGGVFLEELSCRRYDKKKCKEQKEHHSYKIGTWNVRTLNQGGKLENLKTEMQKNEVSVLGVSEVRWKGQGEIRSGDYNNNNNNNIDLTAIGFSPGGSGF